MAHVAHAADVVVRPEPALWQLLAQRRVRVQPELEWRLRRLERQVQHRRSQAQRLQLVAAVRQSEAQALCCQTHDLRPWAQRLRYSGDRLIAEDSG
jgi:hypothetical protein